MNTTLDDTLLRLHETDNVAILKRAVKAGTPLAVGSTVLVASRDIPAGHKIATAEISADEPVRKIGRAHV